MLLLLRARKKIPYRSDWVGLDMCGRCCGRAGATSSPDNLCLMGDGRNETDRAEVEAIGKEENEFALRYYEYKL